MNNEQMREALRLLQEIHPGNMTPMAEENWKAATVLIEQTLATETAPLVRLTDEDVKTLPEFVDFNVCTTSDQDLISFADAIMDAMIKKNGECDDLL